MRPHTLVPMTRPLLSLALETLEERVGIASSEPLVGLLGSWPGVSQADAAGVDVSPSVWRYQDVAIAGSAAVLGATAHRATRARGARRNTGSPKHHACLLP